MPSYMLLLYDGPAAAECYRQALSRPCSEPERRFLGAASLSSDLRPTRARRGR